MNLTVSWGVLVGLRPTFCPDDLSSPLVSQGCVLGGVPAVGVGSMMYIPRTGEG